MHRLASGLICLLVLGLSGLGTVAAAPVALKFEPVAIEMIDEMETDFYGLILENGFIVTIKVNAPEDGRIWVNDFGLAYFDGEEEYRYFCQAMTSPLSSIDDEAGWKYDPFGFTKVKKGTRYFKAFFPLQVPSFSMLAPPAFEPEQQLEIYFFTREFAAKPLFVNAVSY